MRLAILALHKIGAPGPGGWETWNYISEEALATFLEMLRVQGYTFVDHDQVSSAFMNGARGTDLPEKSALVSFDDGYTSMLHNAAPVLARFSCPAVLFVPTNFVGGTNVFDQDNEPVETMCTWDELRELRDRGWSIQSHSRSHTTFSHLSPDEIRIELEASKQLLEAELERPVTAFAFPYGDAGDGADAIAATQSILAATGYQLAYLYKGGMANPATTPRYAITRIPIGPDTDLEAQLA